MLFVQHLKRTVNHVIDAVVRAAVHVAAAPPLFYTESDANHWSPDSTSFSTVNMCSTRKTSANANSLEHIFASIWSEP